MTSAKNLPGIVFAAVIGIACLVVSQFVPVVSALLLAIIVGIVLRNLGALPAWSLPGVGWSSKKLLRFGIVLLGLQLSLGSLAELGLGGVLLLISVVAATFFGTLAVGRALGVSHVSRFLIATGFSICGASAVAAMSSVIDPRQESEEEVAQAVALVTLYGTAALFLLPLLAELLGLSARESGLWIGASVHEVAQVIAAASAIGAVSLSVATIAKLGRVVMLAPLVAAVGVRESVAAGRGSRDSVDGEPSLKRPPIVPLYVLGFLAMVLVRTFVPVPPELLRVVSLVTTALLAIAMFGLGTGVDVRKLIRTGGRPAALGAASSLIAAGAALAGIFALRVIGI